MRANNPFSLRGMNPIAGRARRTLGALALALLVLATPAVAAHRQALSLAPAAPEDLGLSAARLGRMDAFLDGEIAAKRKAGAVVLIARRGKIAYLKAYGWADLERRQPMRTDAYFRLYSMTKPITSVALLTLYEQGKFQLDDPVAKYLPAFKNVKVFKGTAATGELLLEDPHQPITVEDLFRHTAGFTYGYFGNTPVDAAYKAAGLEYAKLDSIRELTDLLATMPLLHHPGTRWEYSFAHDVQAYLVEYFSGMRFDEYCRKTIFEPLGMREAVFGMPGDRAARFPTLYGPGPDGGIAPSADPGADLYTRLAAHPFGGVGLSSTPTAYLRFAQMLLNGGDLDGVRILGRKTVELMVADHLQPAIPPLEPGYGYGLGVGVVTNATQNHNLGSAGQFGWGGYATTSVLIDPKEQLVGLLFAQYLPADGGFRDTWTTLVYQSIVR